MFVLFSAFNRRVHALKMSTIMNIIIIIVIIIIPVT